jgi:hypothetical protein
MAADDRHRHGSGIDVPSEHQNLLARGVRSQCINRPLNPRARFWLFAEGSGPDRSGGASGENDGRDYWRGIPCTDISWQG